MLKLELEAKAVRMNYFCTLIFFGKSNVKKFILTEMVSIKSYDLSLWIHIFHIFACTISPSKNRFEDKAEFYMCTVTYFYALFRWERTLWSLFYGFHRKCYKVTMFCHIFVHRLPDFKVYCFKRVIIFAKTF